VNNLLTQLSIEPLTAVLFIPAVTAAVLALLPSYWVAARLNVLVTFVTLTAAVWLLFDRPPAGEYLFIDDLNNAFIVLTTFVAFTTSVFSASYIAHELEIGRLTPQSLALLPRHVSDPDVRHEPRAGRKQYRPDVGGCRARHPHHRIDGRNLPHP